jgi:hypothetical protein
MFLLLCLSEGFLGPERSFLDPRRQIDLGSGSEILMQFAVILRTVGTGTVDKVNIEKVFKILHTRVTFLFLLFPLR